MGRRVRGWRAMAWPDRGYMIAMMLLGLPLVAGAVRVFGYTGLKAAFDALQVGNAYAWTGVTAELAAATQGAGLASDEAPAAETLTLFPNPATGEVHLLGMPAGTWVQFCDALGRAVRESFLGATSSLSVSDLAPGLYVLRATTAAGRTYTRRLAVE